ncbi:hypothetical protein [Microbulbifer guangxiensis]|uniref:hypothetical protein n=1 Tax=Microbulbifer guangxiensis TaxID=2904249 RepID=UPI001F1FC1A7|nr:hypothetical protein [Microbulbifer guangxiensis]
MNFQIHQWLHAALAAIPLLWLSPVFAASEQGGQALPGEGLESRYQQASLVARVQISGIHRDVDNALSEPGMVAVRGYVYSAVSRRLWKGEATQLLAFRLGLEACQTKLREGEHYIIFAAPDTYGRLQLDSCEAAVPETEAAGLLAQLDQIARQG